MWCVRVLVVFYVLLVAVTNVTAQAALVDMDATRDIRPVPDPTVLTTQQLYRELASLRVELQKDLLSLRTLLESRLEGNDKAVLILQKIADRIPTDIDTRVGQLQALHGEKFRSIENQFASSKLALDSALQASEKSVADKNSLSAVAIAKAENQATKQLEQLNDLIKSSERVANDKIIALKERLDRMDGQGNGIAGSWGVIISVVGIIGVVVAVGVTLRHKGV